MTTNSRKGAYYVPDIWKEWWDKLTNWQFHRFLSIATGQKNIIHSQRAEELPINTDMEYPVTKYAKEKAKEFKCHKCSKDLAENERILVCDKCFTFII